VASDGEEFFMSMQGSGRPGQENDAFDERFANAPMSRDEGQYDRFYDGRAEAYRYPRSDGYGYAGWGRRRRGGRSYGQRMGGGGLRPLETKPFLLTSEFLVTVLAIVALGITAASMNIVNAPLTWILTASMVVGYVLSRGLAKAGTKSYAADPRERMLAGAMTGGAQREDEQSAQHQAQFGAGRQELAYHGRQPYLLETKPFFLTSEFVSILLAVIALACTAAAMPNLGARLTWILVAAMVFTYALSRGIAKAGTRSHSIDPREQLFQRDRGTESQGMAAGSTGRGPVHAVETKPFFVTSEFLGTLLAIIAIAISAASINIFNVRLAWILITAMVCGYVLSRGLAKIGTGSQALDPRELLLERAFQGDARRDEQRSYQSAP
jgi:hypothetical protein